MGENRKDLQWAVILTAIGWAACLAWSIAAARVFFADGSYAVLHHVLNPLRFNDYDPQRSFASHIIQAPVLLGQRLGVDSIAAQSALSAIGYFGVPAAAFLFSLLVARRQPLLLAANLAGIAVFGFGANFINTEANLLFGLVWLAATILAVAGPAPVLCGVVLPLAGVALLRMYEGMFLVGPVLALWAWTRAARSGDAREQAGLAIAGTLFAAGAAIAFGGALAPRDPANAAGFLASVFSYVKNPQAFLLLAALVALASLAPPRRLPARAPLVVAAGLGLAFLWGLKSVEGYYSYVTYYHNRSFLVFALPVAIAALYAVYLRRPAWLGAAGAPPREAIATLLVPVAFAMAGDLLNTWRWQAYVDGFCSVLQRNLAPAEGVAELRRMGVRTGWQWTHPTMSVLLRDSGSNAMVANEPGQRFEPFDPANPPRIRQRGLCQQPLLGSARPDSWAVPVAFAGGRFPTYVKAVRGLSTSESWGTWSEGPQVEFEFVEPLPRSFDLVVGFGLAFGPNKGAPVIVRAGGEEKSFVIDREPFSATIPFRDAREARTLTFVVPRPTAPAESGQGNDPRKLGLGFVSLVVVPR